MEPFDLTANPPARSSTAGFWAKDARASIAVCLGAVSVSVMPEVGVGPQAVATGRRHPGLGWAEPKSQEATSSRRSQRVRWVPTQPN